MFDAAACESLIIDETRGTFDMGHRFQILEHGISGIYVPTKNGNLIRALRGEARLE